MASFTTLFGHSTTSKAAPTPVLSSRSSTARHHRPRIQWAAALFLALSLASHTLAFPLLDEADELPEPTAAPVLAEILLLDTQVPAFLEEGRWTMLEPEENELRRRAAVASSTVTTTFEITIPRSTATATGTTTHSDESSSESSSQESSSHATTSASATSSTATATTSSSSLPSPFDGGLSNNFTSTTCPIFINNMLADAEFQACYPVSLLLQSSQSFFDAEKSLVSISTVLDHACAANATRCTSYLADIAQNLTESANCGSDYAAGVPTATEAFLGLVSYPVMYSATCLKDPDTNAYCFGNAVTNQTNPTETYFYHLPLNNSLPGGTIPVCGSCLQQTMNIYQVATANRHQPIAYTYESAADQVNMLCGPTFANQTLATEIISSAGSSGLGQGPSAWVLSTCFLIILMSWLL